MPRRPDRRPTTALECTAHEVLQRVGDKWSVYVIFLLGDRTRRFTELRRSINGISQRMLTVTLRNLERDGLIIRTVYPVVPPRVEYTLTRLGRTLRDIVGALVAWADKHKGDIDRARATYDVRMVKNGATLPAPRSKVSGPRSRAVRRAPYITPTTRPTSPLEADR